VVGFAGSFFFTRSDRVRAGSSESRRTFSLGASSARFNAYAAASVLFPTPPLPPKK
jgi:hypothetical protein